MLLTKTIALLEDRNKKTAFKFLTPFLVSSQNLKTRYTNYEIEEFKISESIKTERYYSINFNSDGILKAYDQYLNVFIPIPEENYESDIDLISNKMASKNIIYINSPPKIEYFSKKLISSMKIIDDLDISIACKDLSEYLHKDYALIDCIKHGFVYHHGSVPDIVRLYIEHLFSENEHISIIVTSSTLLEGVNIPAEKLFLLDYMKGRRKLSPSQFKNLSGRVCRFREMFDMENGSLSMLEPAIYMIGSDYVKDNSNIENFLIQSVKVDKTIKDDLQNVLLTETDLNDDNMHEKQKADEILENIKKGITGGNANYAKTEVGKLCFLNNITEFSITEHENEIAEQLKSVEKHGLRNPEQLIHLISNAFISYIDKNHNDYSKLIRLKQDSAQRFYSMFIKWRMRNASYSEMIRGFLDYWNREDTDKSVYVGKWGDTKKEGYNKMLWVDISEKSIKQRVNLAIVRIKEEQDFLDNTIIKFLEVLYELELVDEQMYLKIKYGTEDVKKITMIKSGISSTLSSLLLDKYLSYVSVNIETNVIEIKSDIIQAMRLNGENNVLIFEVGFNIHN